MTQSHKTNMHTSLVDFVEEFNNKWWILKIIWRKLSPDEMKKSDFRSFNHVLNAYWTILIILIPISK